MHAHFDLLPFQLEPAMAVVRGLGARVLIADEVGLGKTVQASLIIAEVLARAPAARSLIVSPAGLRDQWQAELRDRFGLGSAIVDAAALARSTAISGNPWTAHPIAVTSIDFVKRPEVVRALETVVWDVVVFDEAHALTGWSDRSTAARTLAVRARTVVLLTATPHSGDDQAFERLAGLGDLGSAFPALAFRRTRRDAGLTERRHTTWLQVRLTPPERAMHRALARYAGAVWQGRGAGDPAARLAMIVLARRACSSASALLRSIDRRRLLLADRVECERPQRSLPFGDGDEEIDAVLAVPGFADAGDEDARLRHLHALATAAAAAETKPAALRRLLRRARQPAIVFTEYRDTQAALAVALAEFRPVLLHGGLTWSERREAVGRFTQGDAPLLLATDAASEGLNLHRRCRLVVNLELPWTPLRLEQRVGRIERIGQRRAVHAIHMVAAGTSEQDTVQTLHRRLARVRDAVDALERPTLSEDDVAQAVFEGTDVIRGLAAARTTTGAGLVGARLQQAARLEAQRIQVARGMCSRPEAALETRPLAAGVRLRGREASDVLIYRLMFEDAACRFVWSSLVGLVVRTLRRPWNRRAAVEWLDACGPDLETLVRGAHEAALVRLQTSLRVPLALAAARERAIFSALEDGHARMAATLLQPGLFDRRVERLSAAQSAVMHEALDQCAARLRALHTAGDVGATRRGLVLALLAR